MLVWKRGMNGEQSLVPPLPEILPIESLETLVSEDFIDRNGHMGASNYFLLFQQALHALFRPLGFGPPYQQRGLTVFQRKALISYERELRLGDPIVIQSWLMGYDERSFHHYHEMRKCKDGPLVASIEYLSTNVDFASWRSVAFQEVLGRAFTRCLRGLDG